MLLLPVTLLSLGEQPLAQQEQPQFRRAAPVQYEGTFAFVPEPTTLGDLPALATYPDRLDRPPTAALASLAFVYAASLPDGLGWPLAFDDAAPAPRRAPDPGWTALVDEPAASGLLLFAPSWPDLAPGRRQRDGEAESFVGEPPALRAEAFHPDAIAARRAETPGGEFGVLPDAEADEGDLSWLPRYPDRLDRPPTPPPGGEFGVLPEAEADEGELGWLPTYPDRVAGRTTPPASGAVLVDAAAGLGLPTAEYPDRLDRPAAAPPGGWFAALPDAESDEGDLGWLPSYPDAARRLRGPDGGLSQGVLAPPAGSPDGWLGEGPDPTRRAPFVHLLGGEAPLAPLPPRPPPAPPPRFPPLVAVSSARQLDPAAPEARPAGSSSEVGLLVSAAARAAAVLDASADARSSPEVLSFGPVAIYFGSDFVVSVQFRDAITGAPFDPADVVFTVVYPPSTTRPSEPVELRPPEVVRDGVGKYHVQLVANFVGTARYAWESRRVGQRTRAEGTFSVLSPTVSGQSAAQTS